MGGRGGRVSQSENRAEMGGQVGQSVNAGGFGHSFVRFDTLLGESPGNSVRRRYEVEITLDNNCQNFSFFSRIGRLAGLVVATVYFLKRGMG